MYHYAGNNPVRYVDPDGKVVTKKVDSKTFTVMSEDLFSVVLFEKIQTSYYPFFVDTIVSLSNDLLAGERKIIEQPNNINADGIILDSISFIGDLDISPKLKKTR